MSIEDRHNHDLLVAAIDVVTSLSRRNLRSNNLSDPIVKRQRIKALEQAIEAILPGVIDRTYEIMEENSSGQR